MFQCPVKAGVYHINGYSFNPDDVDIPPIFESGEYMVKSALYRNGKLINGGKFFFTLISKVPGMV
jgi:hypothetical protein